MISKNRKIVFLCIVVLFTQPFLEIKSEVFADDEDETSFVEGQTDRDSTENKDLKLEEESIGRSIITGTWGTSAVSFDEVSGVLEVESGTISPYTLKGSNRKINKNNVKKIILKDGVKGAEDVKHLFSGADNMFPKLVSLTGKLDLSNSFNMEYMFFLSKISNLNLNDWNTSKVVNMDGVFWGYEGSTLSIDQWNTSSVTSMISMFDHASNITSLNLSTWNTSNVKNTNYMFQSTTNLVNLDISSFDTSSVTSMKNMFQDAENLTSLNLSNFDTSQVTSMQNMFNNARNLTSLDLSNFDTSQVTSMQNMFSNARNLTSLDLSNFDTSQVTSMQNMFSNARNLTSLDLSNFDTSQVTNMQSMFEGTPIVDLDISSFNTGKVTKMYDMVEFTPLRSIKFGNKTWLPKGSIWVRQSDFGDIDTYQIWRPVGSGTIEHPKGDKVFDTLELLRLFEPNSNMEKNADIYVKSKDLSTIVTKDSIVERGGVWNPIDNFVSATDIDGHKIPFKDSMVWGEVDVNGYEIQQRYFINGKAESQFTVTLRDTVKPTIEAMHSEIYVGDSWEPEDNFISATDKFGEPVDFDISMVKGTVDTTKVGYNKVVYTNDTVSKEIHVTVRKNRASLEIKNSKIDIGDSWEPEDNFVSATDKLGKPVEFKDIKVEGDVDTSQKGTYKINYSNAGITKKVTVTVGGNEWVNVTIPTEVLFSSDMGAKEKVISKNYSIINNSENTMLEVDLASFSVNKNSEVSFLSEEENDPTEPNTAIRLNLFVDNKETVKSLNSGTKFIHLRDLDPEEKSEFKFEGKYFNAQSDDSFQAKSSMVLKFNIKY